MFGNCPVVLWVVMGTIGKLRISLKFWCMYHCCTSKIDCFLITFVTPLNRKIHCTRYIKHALKLTYYIKSALTKIISTHSIFDAQKWYVYQNFKKTLSFTMVYFLMQNSGEIRPKKCGECEQIFSRKIASNKSAISATFR